MIWYWKEKDNFLRKIEIIVNILMIKSLKKIFFKKCFIKVRS